MKSLYLLLAVVVAAVSLASLAGSAKASPCTSCALQSNLANMRHETLKAIANNLRG
jgi:hypothetical protein